MATETSKQQRALLFVHSTGPTHVHQRDKATKTKIHRHVMVEIGKTWRKPPRNPQFDTVVQFPERIRPRKGIEDRQQPKSSALAGSNTTLISTVSYQPLLPSAYYETFMSLVPPFWEQHPLTTLESHWADDMFSAYGMVLLLRVGSNLADPNYLTKGFWFPFAFQSSRFLNAFQHVFRTPDILGGVSRALSTKFTIMALERSSTTITCIEKYLGSPNFHEEASNIVIRAVVAIICYNFISSDFSQALVHLRGLELLINFRGGIHHLQGQSELKLMIFWIDITASLLYRTRPRFPPPLDLIPPIHPAAYSQGTTVPLLTLITPERTMNTNDMLVLSCITDLTAIAGLINAEVAVKGESFWTNAVHIELQTNTIIHRLLEGSSHTDSMPQDTTFEALRLGAILWITYIKQRCGSFLGSSGEDVTSLLDLLSLPTLWEDAADVLDRLAIPIWLLVISGISVCDPEQHQRFSNLIASEMKKQGWNWDQLMVSAHRMPWISDFDTLCAQLKERVQLD